MGSTAPRDNLPPVSGDSTGSNAERLLNLSSAWNDSSLADDATGPLPRADSSDVGSAATRAADISPDEKTVISKRSQSPAPRPVPARSQDPGRVLEGEQLGHFRLEEFVGSGGMGAVYRATDLTLERSVALKVVSREHTDDETLRRFRNEAQSAARLDHPNIARVYFVGEDRGWRYIVFEFIEGVNVRDLVAHKGPLPLDEAISYTLDVADALEHASRRDVVHRDIKPSNILITPEGRAKLVDMGLARLHQVEAPSNELTQSGVTLGTFDYISPEQARDPRAADVRSDLYSLGCTFYYMLTGLPPFPDGTVLQKLLSHSSAPPPDPRQQRPDLPESITRVLTKLLAKQPNHRYQEPKDLIAALLTIAQDQGLPIASRASAIWSAPADQRPSAFERHAPWIVPAVLLLTIVFLMEAFAYKGLAINRDETGPAWSAEDVPGASPASSSVRSPAAEEAVPPGRDLENTTSAAPLTGVVTPIDGGAGKTNVTATPVTEPPALGGTATNDQDKPAATTDVKPPESRPTTGTRAPSSASESPLPTDATPAASARLVAKADEMNERRVPIKRLVVGDAPSELSDGVRYVPSLAAAVRELAGLAEIETIELSRDQTLDEPLVLRLKRPLLIRSVEGSQAVISYQPKAYAVNAQAMLRVVGGDLTLQGIHWRLNLSDAPGDSRAMFHLEMVAAVRCRDCLMTIDNQGEQAIGTFFALGGSKLSMMMPMESGTFPNGPDIELVRCLVRGQATFLRSTDGVPFRLSWRQGMFLSTEHFLVVRAAPEQVGVGRLDIDLNRLLIRADRGLALLEADAISQQMHNSVFNLRNCLVLHDETVPLVEHLGTESLEIAQVSFALRGEENAYPQTRTLWSVQLRDLTRRDFLWEARVNEAWYTERLATRNVGWEVPRPLTRDVQQQGPKEYHLSDRDRATYGCQAEELPRLPSSAEVPRLNSAL